MSPHGDARLPIARITSLADRQQRTARICSHPVPEKLGKERLIDQHQHRARDIDKQQQDDDIDDDSGGGENLAHSRLSASQISGERGR